MPLALEPPYVTVDDYKNAAEGIDISAVTDAELVAILRRASRHVDAYTGEKFFPRQVVERHGWRQDSRRIYPHHLPVISVDAARIGSGSSQEVRVYVGNQAYAQIDNDDLFIHNEHGWIEFLDLTTVYSISPALISLGLASPVVEIVYTAGWGTRSVADTGVVDAQNSKKYTFSNQLWTTESFSLVSEFRKSAVLVYVNGVEQSASSYRVDPVDGQVIFNAAPAGTVTATYWYATPPEHVQWATVAIATELLGERLLAQNQMTGLQSASWAGMSMSRKQDPDWPINQRAKSLLGPQKAIALR